MSKITELATSPDQRIRHHHHRAGRGRRNPGRRDHPLAEQAVRPTSEAFPGYRGSDCTALRPVLHRAAGSRRGGGCMTSTIKSRVFAALPEAYAEVSQRGRLPALARNVGYAVRRLTGLGDALDLTRYFLKGPNGGLLNEYLDTHPTETANWDVIRDARGSFYEPHTFLEVKMGTLAVRRHLAGLRSWGGVEDDTQPPKLGLLYPTYGPVNQYGTVLYWRRRASRRS